MSRKFIDNKLAMFKLQIWITAEVTVEYQAVAKSKQKLKELEKFADKQPIDWVLPDEGVMNELQELAEVFLEQDNKAILNDISNFLRMGDVTNIKSEGGLHDSQYYFYLSDWSGCHFCGTKHPGC